MHGWQSFQKKSRQLTPNNTQIFLALVLIKMLTFSLLQFYDAAKTAKNLFAQADRTLGMIQFYKHCHHN